jgi:putative ATP-dependent endonuclease of the OLD family
LQSRIPVFRRGERRGIFVNANTLEPELFATRMRRKMVSVIKAELPLRQPTRDRLDRWEADPTTLEIDPLITLIERVGKGRFAQRIASAVRADRCPAYIRAALERIRDAVA